ncbi:MAG: hypothetical protein AAB386_03110 [Patescibacteria group bacterium]
MKKILILEGIASSGKTTLEKLLVARLNDSIILSENYTLMPIIDNRNIDIALAHLQKQIQTIVDSSAQNIIVDRFHLTHAFRTQSDLDAFSEIEDGLQKAGNVLIVLLTIDPERIRERVEETVLHRKDNWKKGAPGNIAGKAAYYAKQQEVLLSLLPISRLPSITINTSDKSWTDYADAIQKKLTIQNASEKK